jgi:hypothetical protein
MVERAQPGLDRRGGVDHDQLVGGGVLDEPLEVPPHLGRRPHRRVPHHVGHVPARGRAQQLVELLVPEPPPSSQHPRHPGAHHRPVLLAGLVLVLGGDDVDAGDHVGVLELGRGLEVLPVQRHGLLQRLGGEVGGEAVRQAEDGGQLGPEQR